MHSFDRDVIESFRFVRADFDASTGRAELVYAFDKGPELIETITFPGAPFQLNEKQNAALKNALLLLHLIAGVSYYKAAVPKTITIETAAIDASLAAMLEEVYVNGLGEFAYNNQLNLHGRIRFPVNQSATINMAEAVLQEATPHALVAIGGGKDSLVSIEALRKLGVAQTVTWIGQSQLIQACAERTGLPLLRISRQLAPQLFDYNKQGAYNGHIPVTAINSAIMVVAAILQGANQVVFSNERSASYGSMIEGTGEVNHQWSKGWAFEQLFSDIVHRYVASDLDYYSLLRPLSELAVARQFAKTTHYDAYFSSCNRNFHILGERPVNRWCGICPKCHFVFLALAPFMPKTRLVGIFGRNLLDDATQIAGYDALLEYQNHKPFECVGEGRESRAAMAVLAERPDWSEDVIVKRFKQEILPQLNPDELNMQAMLQLDDSEQNIPPSLWMPLREYFAA